MASDRKLSPEGLTVCVFMNCTHGYAAEREKRPQESRANDPCRPAALRWDGGSLDYIDRLNAFGILRGMYLVTKGNGHSGASDTYIYV